LTTTKSNQYFPALTGVRALAAYMVFIHHYEPFDEANYGSIAYHFFREMHIGVALFFVLSGFLIGYRYLDSTQINFRKYIVNRIARVYPMYFILTTITFLVWAITKEQDHLQDLILYLANISFIRGYSETYKFSGVAQGWSLTVEETFYLIAPLSFILIRKNKINLLLIPLALLITGSLLVFVCKDHNLLGFFSTYDFMFNYTFFGRCFEFFIGIALAVFLQQNPSVRDTKYLTYVGLFIILLCAFSLSLVRGDADFGIRQPIGKIINTFLMPLFGIAVFYYGLVTETTLLSKLFSSKPMQLLGKSSYIFYLIHIGILALFLGKYITNNFLLFVTINVIAVLMFLFIEEPLNNLIRRKFAGNN
jgi:peptidoglycan/LPS O-acetylase OafA/YrhL